MDYRDRAHGEQLDSVNDFLTGLTVSDDYRTLSGGEKNPLKAYLASYTLITQLKTALPAYGDVGAFFIYSAPSDAERDIFDDSISYAQKERLRAFVRDAVENNTYSYNMQWRHAEIGRQGVFIPLLRRARHVSCGDGCRWRRWRTRATCRLIPTR